LVVFLSMYANKKPPKDVRVQVNDTTMFNSSTKNKYIKIIY